MAYDMNDLFKSGNKTKNAKTMANRKAKFRKREAMGRKSRRINRGK